MGRWDPNASERLRLAAMQLYVEQGYDRTTVAEIAERAGLTARTFFRHFGDKREVLFSGSEELLTLMVQALHATPVAAGPLDAVAAALDAVARRLGTDRDWSRSRQDLIATHPDLQERERTKLGVLSGALASALRDRGVADPAASLAAEAGVACFRVAFESWVSEPRERPLQHVMVDTLRQLRAVAAT